MVVGDRKTLTGDVTKLGAINAKAPPLVEEMLGYGAGRLARGYWICLLSGRLTPGDFELGGNTLRSGGKLGLPQQSREADDRRVRVHKQILEEYGAAGYVALQNSALRDITATGPHRIAKVVPVQRHSDDSTPADQYPMGGGALQWTLLAPGKLFLVAAFVDAQAQAHTPGFTVGIAPAAPYDGRARLLRYLQEVSAD